MDNKKIFLSGLYSDYLNLQEKDDSILYFCTDTKKIFKGDIEITSECEFYFEKPSAPVPGKIYVSIESGTVEFFDGTEWIPASGSIVGTNNVTNQSLAAGSTTVTFPIPDEGDVVDFYTANGAQYASIECDDTNTRSGNGTITVTYPVEEVNDIVYMRTYHNDIYSKILISSLCLDRIVITSLPDTAFYLKNEKLDLTGLQVTGYFGTDTFDLTDTVITIPGNGEKLKTANDSLSVRVIYGTLETSFNITVANSFSNIAVSNLPSKTVYNVMEQLDLTGIEVSGIYGNKSKNITNNCIYTPANGTTLDDPTLNSVSVRYGNLSTSFAIRVIKEDPAIYNTVKNAGTVTEVQWREFVESGCIGLVRDKEEESLFIGKNVTIVNDAQTTYQTWKIADFNHDNSGDTCDLIQENTVISLKFADSVTEVCLYENSILRNWLLTSYLPNFKPETRNLLQTMSVNSNGTILNDKIKLLSFTEINGTTGSSSKYYIEEGTPYPIFTNNNSRKRAGARELWWTRSRYTYIDGGEPSKKSWAVYNLGTIFDSAYIDAKGILPCIRFA